MCWFVIAIEVLIPFGLFFGPQGALVVLGIILAVLALLVIDTGVRTTHSTFGDSFRAGALLGYTAQDAIKGAAENRDQIIDEVRAAHGTDAV